MKREKLTAILNRAVRDGVTPGGVLAVSADDLKGREGHHFVQSFGYTEVGNKGCPVTPQTVYDLASLTKPLVTVLSLLTLLEKGKIGLGSTLAELLKLSVPSDKKNIRLDQLMSHSSGFPAHRNYFVPMLGIAPEKRKEWLLQTILAENLEYTPGKKHLYSDLGFLVLGWIIERQTGYPLDNYYSENVINPLGLQEELFFNSIITEEKRKRENCGATEICPWSHKILCGTVHDDNCRMLGGVCGHAGLFGTAGGVVTLCGLIRGVLQGRRDISLFSRDSLYQITKRVGNSTWSCGFDMPSTLYSSSGKYFSPSSIGHLGFTGTSFWIDWQRGITVVLLTNRVNPQRANEKIKRFRPMVHNVIMEQLAAG